MYTYDIVHLKFMTTLSYYVRTYMRIVRDICYCKLANPLTKCTLLVI